MSKPKAHVSKKKKEEVKRLMDLLRGYKTIGIINLENLPSPQMQKLKNKLKQNMLVYVTKKRLISLAIDNLKEITGLNQLKDCLEMGIPSLVLSNDSPFKIARLMNINKSSASAKAGQKSPKDILISAGPTPFTPGPIIGELGSVGLKTAVEEGKIVIKQEKIIVHKDEEINPKVADILSKLKIEPMEIGINLVGIFESGILYLSDVLNVDDKTYKSNFVLASQQAFNLAINSGYTIKETIEILLRKACVESFALAKTSNLIIDESVIQGKEDLQQLVRKEVETQPEEKEVKEEPKIEKKAEDKSKLIVQKQEKAKEEPKIEIKQIMETKPQRKEKPPENVIDDLLHKARTTGLTPEVDDKPKTHSGPSEDDVKKAEEFVKGLISNVKPGDLGPGVLELKRRREEEKKKKERQDKEFKEAEKKAQEILKGDK
ncbi:MAG: 50S ribosomal protein L10 [Candidatus Woesearchaeota archaeon]|nr:MAG: 50S ribosomal protein L10 [Candidatus Woesearchaeota archaeon]